jgi:hypothetical protein
LELLPDHIDLGVVGDGLERDVRHALIDEAVADVAVGRAGWRGCDFASFDWPSRLSASILVSDLHKDRAGNYQLSFQQIASDGEAIAQIGEIEWIPSRQVSRNALTCSGSRVMWSTFAVLHVAAGRGPLEIGVELDAVGRIDVNALHLPRRPSRSASDAITCRLSPRIMRLLQFCVVLVELGLGVPSGTPLKSAKRSN